MEAAGGFWSLEALKVPATSEAPQNLFKAPGGHLEAPGGLWRLVGAPDLEVA